MRYIIIYVEDWCFHPHHLTFGYIHIVLVSLAAKSFLVVALFWIISLNVYLRGVCSFLLGGVLLPGAVPGSDGGGGDAHQTGSGQGRAGEVSTVQRYLQCS